MLFVLDLDNTLLFCASSWTKGCPHFSFRLHGQIYHVYVRPGFFAFLNYLLFNHNVAIWTAATPQYANCVLNHLFGKDYKTLFTFCYTRRNCIFWSGQYVKDMRRLPPESVLIDDNEIHEIFMNSVKCTRRYIIKCIPFEGWIHDRELFHILRYIKFRTLIG